jgi:hypothetical protein
MMTGGVTRPWFHVQRGAIRLAGEAVEHPHDPGERTVAELQQDLAKFSPQLPLEGFGKWSAMPFLRRSLARAVTS